MIPVIFNRHRTLLSILILVLGLIWIVASAEGQIIPNHNPAPRRGFLAPDFNLVSLNGNQVQLSDYRGQSVMINFWASWCPPCRAEMPTFQKIYQEYAPQGFTILAVNSQESASTAASFAQPLALTFPVLLDENGAISNRYRADSLPTTIFVNKDGVIREVMYGGPISEAVLRIQIEKMLKETP